MFEKLFIAIRTIALHRDAPLADERERYLCHCSDQGSTLLTLAGKARCLLHIAQRMAPNDYGHIDALRLQSLLTPGYAAGTVDSHTSCIRPWFKFLGWWRVVQRPVAFEDHLNEFTVWMRDERGLSPCTVEQWRMRAGQFLNWFSDTGRDLHTLTPQDIDTYFVSYGAQRWSRLSARHMAQALRIFLRHAAEVGTCDVIVAESIRVPRVYSLESLPYAVGWDEVRRVIDAADTGEERDIRDRAILLLLAVYGLRRGEVAALRLDQVDRKAGQLHIWRLKSNQPQVYPLVPSVLQALDKYINEVRPKVDYPEVFLRVCSPRQPITARGLYNVVARRLCVQGVQAAHLGPHALRHSCAAKMLADGLTLKQIGDHLGHRSTSATQVYTKVDMNWLRQVGDFDLGELQ